MEEGKALLVQVGRIAATLIFGGGGKEMHFCWAEERYVAVLHVGCASSSNTSFIDDTKEQIDEDERDF